MANASLRVVTQMIVQASDTAGSRIHLRVQLFLVANKLSHVLSVVQSPLAVGAQRCLRTLPHYFLQKKKAIFMKWTFNLQHSKHL